MKNFFTYTSKLASFPWCYFHFVTITHYRHSKMLILNFEACSKNQQWKHLICLLALISLDFLQLLCSFFRNKRQSIIQVLSEEFCSSLSDIIEIPTFQESSGGSCSLQEENIVFEDNLVGNETVIFVNFELVINSTDNNSSRIMIRLKNVMDEMANETKSGIVFYPGEISGKYQLIFIWLEIIS